MDRLGREDHVIRLLNNLGLVEMYGGLKTSPMSSIFFAKDRSKTDNPNHRVSFHLLNIDYEISLEAFCSELGDESIN